jgi:DNA-binding NarL/FixJ family response regulator
VADATPLARAGLRSVCEDAGMCVVGEAANSADLVRLARAARPDLCVMDLDLPGDALTCVRDLSNTAVAVVVLTNRPEATELLAAARAGAQGYVAKDRDADCLPQALAAVLAGEAAVPRGLVSALLSELALGPAPGTTDAAGDPRLSLLTGREREVLALLRRGVPTSTIAAGLFVAPVTVRSHVCAIMRKLNVSDRADLVDAPGCTAMAAPPRRPRERRSRRTVG